MRWLYISVIVPACVVIPIAIAFIRYRKLAFSLKPVVVYLLVAGITNLIASMLAHNSINNMPLLHLYTVVEFLLLAAFYRRIFESTLLKITNWMCIVFPLLCLLNALFVQSIYSNPTITRSAESFLISTLAVCWFFRMPETGKDAANLHEAQFPINTGILLYFAGAFFLFLFARMLQYKPGDIMIWRIHATLVLLMYLLFSAGFLRSKNDR